MNIGLGMSQSAAIRLLRGGERVDFVCSYHRWFSKTRTVCGYHRDEKFGENENMRLSGHSQFVKLTKDLRLRRRCRRVFACDDCVTSAFLELRGPRLEGRGRCVGGFVGVNKRFGLYTVSVRA
jgi:hypothetical protein